MTPHDNRVTLHATPARSSSSAAEAHDTRELRECSACCSNWVTTWMRCWRMRGLRREDVENPDAVIAPSACAAVFAAAHRERRVPNLPLQLAIHTPVGATPLLDYLIVSADSVGRASTGSPGISASSIEASGSTVARIVKSSSRGRGARARRFETELTRRALDPSLQEGNRWPAAPSTREFHARARRCGRVRGGAGMPDSCQSVVEWVGLVEGRDEPRAASSRSGSEPMARATRRPEILARLPADGDVRDEVRSVLSTQLTSGDMRIDVVARRLATTPRTLQRRLARAGTTFEALCDDARKQAARTYLADTTLTIAEVTYLLGYSEPTAFHRAFRRWHGDNPSGVSGADDTIKGGSDQRELTSLAMPASRPRQSPRRVDVRRPAVAAVRQWRDRRCGWTVRGVPGRLTPPSMTAPT